MYLIQCVAVCLLAPLVGAQSNNVPGAPQYMGATSGGIEPWPPGVGGSDDDEGFLAALKKPNLTGTYEFATPNISAPETEKPGEYTEESNSVLQGWSLSVALTAGVPFRENHYVAGELVLNTPKSLLTNMTMTDEGNSDRKNVSVADDWRLCIIQWGLGSKAYPSALRHDDGTCSSVLSPDCIRALQDEARSSRRCSAPRIQDLPACADDDTRPFQAGALAAWHSASRIREFPQGHAEMMAFATWPQPGGPGNLTAYNDMGTVAWPMLLTLRAGGPAARWSGLFCVRPTEAVNGSTLPVWEKKDEEEGGEGSGKGGEAEGQSDEEGAAINIVIDSVSMFGLGAVALAYLML
ncbi:hypothetical protein PG996_000030 [Apiospora saccharicola]|uniref:Uncharacterized protein n=1 Tax=Apiospora saccharicola TaxID=335842 RepID=A0ABR1WCK7_9PEZI